MKYIKKFRVYENSNFVVISDRDCVEIFTDLVDSGYSVSRERCFHKTHGSLFEHADILPNGVFITDETPIGQIGDLKKVSDEFNIFGQESMMISNDKEPSDKEEVVELDRLVSIAMRKMREILVVSSVSLNVSYYHGARYIKVKY